MNLQSEVQENRPSCYGRLVKEECAALKKRSVYYRLLETHVGYLIEICLGKEQLRLPAGESIARAALLYERLVKGTVTPCTAWDVWEDFSATS